MHPRKPTWNLKIPPSKRRNIYKTTNNWGSMLVFRGCKLKKLGFDLFIPTVPMFHHLSSSSQSVTAMVSGRSAETTVSGTFPDVLKRSCGTRKRIQWCNGLVFRDKNNQLLWFCTLFWHSQWAVLDGLYYCLWSKIQQTWWYISQLNWRYLTCPWH